MEKFQLSEDVYVKTVAILVKDVEEMVNFYKNVLGFILKLEENNLSIFGSQKKDSRLLILEEVESEQEQLDFSSSVVCFSLLIPTEEEFGSLLRRITAHNYPIKASIRKGQRQSILLEDPEGNELEVSYQGESTRCKDVSEILDIEPLIEQSNVLYSSLSADVRFDRIKLRVVDKATHAFFYNHILGMSSEEQVKDKLSMNEGKFEIHLDDSKNAQKHSVAVEKSLGVDFFVLTVNHEEEIKRLKQHLEKQKQDFFVDKKLTILTIYDPSQIEWWFVRN
ncbi:hypothetical protein UAY_02129 [Enterococcus moraviensis ATCC BAA-383]|uniref:VOC domain-containing protein n=1 Tax=Enterococcus moraviensis ATCC BAA-383 TaxID=1158609 RepID=R2SUE6_9ENTE|nr:VOC family protein [Enterococcus moraviensis]EOH98860.1 hypothetical protein UAY_02129 [Enterococcus moraviensis ATCC BAA-383]EOT71965.1 hypothetical protein I586_01772 [Enterococcus moraviensis ATCC BAA-383]OJG68084.1 hypothetical protein RV09_GL002195 [Enterococcus moraviensis]